jgi:hypothetical protein
MMRCQKWPDDRCRSPVACEGFGYCRERNWDYRGQVSVPRGTDDLAAWRKADDDGKPAGRSYAARND